MKFNGLIIGRTITVTLSDSSVLLSTIVDAQLGEGMTRTANAVWITIEGSAGYRIAFGVDATQTLGHAFPAQTLLRLPYPSMIAAARVANAVSAQNAVLQITLEK